MTVILKDYNGVKKLCSLDMRWQKWNGLHEESKQKKFKTEKKDFLMKNVFAVFPQFQLIFKLVRKRKC